MLSTQRAVVVLRVRVRVSVEVLRVLVEETLDLLVRETSVREHAVGQHVTDRALDVVRRRSGLRAVRRRVVRVARARRRAARARSRVAGTAEAVL